MTVSDPRDECFVAILRAISAKPEADASRMLDRVQTVIAQLRPARERACLTLDELIQVARVKSGSGAEDGAVLRGAAAVTKNRSEDVREITRMAFVADLTEDVRIRVLCALRGIGVPVASAVLAWTFPEKWPVIDRRAWASLAAFGLVQVRSKERPFSAVEWLKYVGVVKSLAEKLNWTPQKVDFWLYANRSGPYLHSPTAGRKQ